MCVFVGTGKEPDLPASTELSTVEEKAKEQRYASGQFFFEYLVVVRPKKTKDGIYEPQIIYQFPKVIHTNCVLCMQPHVAFTCNVFSTFVEL